jgi:NDP-sugar pyrophosphorylase family protein
VNILIPAAGEGQRFKDAGYEDPKPLIQVAGRPMLGHVVHNLRPFRPHRFVIVSQIPDDRLRLVPWIHYGDLTIHTDPTGGALETILKARDVIQEGPLLVANCDQLVGFDVNNFLASAQHDGTFVTFKSSKEHHSYVLVENGVIRSIVEKMAVSYDAIAGVYYFADGLAFLNAAEEVVRKDYRVLGEYYVSTAIYLMIERGYRFTTYDAPVAILGTPEEMQLFEMAVKVAKGI